MNVRYDRIGGTLTDSSPIKIATAHPRFRAEGDEVGADLRHISAAQPVFLLGENDNRSAFRCLVREARQLRRVRQRLAPTPSMGINSVAMRLPSVMVPVLSRSRVYVARCFHRASAHGENILPE